MQGFNPELFTKEKVDELKETIGKKKALVAISGGVDSTTCAVLVHKAIGKNLLCVMLDDAFMRENEPQRIAELVSKPPIELPIRILNVQERFLKAMEGLEDAEEKRVVFRDTFYKVLSETAAEEKCSLLVQGTIKADVIETTGGVKTQHNVLQQVGINTMERFGFEVIEPISSLFKPQVRAIARYLGIPDEIANRQPFPGPGLSVRVVGEIRRDKLDSTKKATKIVEETFEPYSPQQYFVAVLDNKTISHPRVRFLQDTAARSLNVPSRHVSIKVFSSKATGVKGNKRRYGGIIGVGAKSANSSLFQPSMKELTKLQGEVTADASFTRLLYLVRDTNLNGAYVAALRAIKTKDFLTAEVAEIPWKTLIRTSDEILRSCKNISAVYYDMTPKPPATIEME